MTIRAFQKDIIFIFRILGSADNPSHLNQIFNWPWICFYYTVKAHLKWYPTVPGTWVIRAMSQCSETYILTRYKDILLYARQPLVTYVCRPKTFHYFTFGPLRRSCRNDMGCMGPLIVAYPSKLELQVSWV